MQETWFSHFHPDEHPFVQRLLEKIDRAVREHTAFQTDFLDPRQQFIVESLVNREPDLHFKMDGGYPEAERKRAWVAQSYDFEQPSNVQLIQVRSIDERLSDFKHGDYLGALLGLGLKREKTGDLHVSEDGCHLLLCSEMTDFVRLHLHQVGRANVQVELLPLEELQISAEAFQVIHITVTSMRLDGIVSDVCKLSRANALVPIKAGRCKVNWRVEESGSCVLKNGDVVSLKGWGRFKLLEVQGVTKKGNFRLKIGKYV